MQLTKLEIKGFKSFGDKVNINFGEGVTGIVGPNGCGKSNIVDAIRWVLGEQKISTLRSEKLENIIFNGTKKRKPTQMAEVSLSFNNTKNILPVEYNQVTITRRFYRSGDSEYLLNGINCRLKDITNLFLDTGVASHSYAIIELSMVDDLLTDKDNSRRRLFEEAAGISKFKLRKKETFRRLKETDADLERVEDLLYEIEKNMRSLERQARQAKRYYKLKDEYKKFSIGLAQTKVSHQRDRSDQLIKQINAENDRKIELNKHLKKQEADLEKAKADLILKEKGLSSKQKALNEHVAKIRQYENEKKIKHERLKYLNDKSESLRDQIAQDKQSNQRAEFSINSLNQEQESANKILREVEEKLRVLRNELEEQKMRTSALQDEVSTIEQIHKNKRDELYQIQKEIEIKQIQLSSLKQELERTTSDTSEKSASLEEFENKIAEIKQAVAQNSKLLDKLNLEEEKALKQIETTVKTIDVIKEERAQLARTLDAKQNEFNLTKSLVDNLEGYPEAIKFLKKKAGWNKTAPLLSDIIGCEEKFRVTIENYLEPLMNYYIVEQENDAYEAINLLNEAARGKAHFFILNKLDRFHPKELKIYDNAIPATEIVDYDNKYKKLLAYVLDGVYIVTGYESVIPADDENILITLNGKITKKRFSLSGGSVGLFEGKRIGRVKNLEKLQVDIKKLQEKINKIDDKLKSEASTLEQLKLQINRSNIEKLREKASQLKQELISVETKQEQIAGLLSGNTVKKEDILEKINELTEETETLTPNSETIKLELEEQEVKLMSIKKEHESGLELLEIRTKAYNEENLQLHQQQNKVASLDQEISFKKTTFESSKERIGKNQLHLEENENEIKKILDSNEIEEDELIALYKEKENIEAEVNESEKSYYSARGEISEIEKKIRELQNQKGDIDDLLMEMQNRLNEVRIEMSALHERLSVEFGIDSDSLKNEELDEEIKNLSQENLQEKVDQLKNQLEKIGPVNPMAMEAYDEIKERDVFITNQKDDLLKAKESLLVTIEEIDLVAKETFLTAFEKIKGNFVKVFRSLFTEEDQCDLKLLDPGNPLESPIEILAKPKGKKPLSVTQLSGGEKTLTATSLLFAIYLLKPAPFCIFDEVDAPLDDANIDKFNNIIRKFSEDSQFIIVTHNKRTMASTNIIYGITMVEQGVSKVVPVDLRDLD